VAAELFLLFHLFPPISTIDIPPKRNVKSDYVGINTVALNCGVLIRVQPSRKKSDATHSDFSLGTNSLKQWNNNGEYVTRI